MKKAVSYIQDFEQTAAEIGISNQYHYVICGHIHQPQKRTVTTAQGGIDYLNSGDWIENLTALEYFKGQWELYQFKEELQAKELPEEEELSTSQLFQNMVREFELLKAV